MMYTYNKLQTYKYMHVLYAQAQFDYRLPNPNGPKQLNQGKRI